MTVNKIKEIILKEFPRLNNFIRKDGDHTATVIAQAIQDKIVVRLQKKKKEFGGTYADVQIRIGENMMIDQIKQLNPDVKFKVAEES